MLYQLLLDLFHLVESSMSLVINYFITRTNWIVYGTETIEGTIVIVPRKNQDVEEIHYYLVDSKHEQIVWLEFDSSLPTPLEETDKRFLLKGHYHGSYVDSLVGLECYRFFVKSRS